MGGSCDMTDVSGTGGQRVIKRNVGWNVDGDERLG
jgi:hypothetical protein